MHTNPAGLANASQLGCGLAYKHMYGLQDITNATLCAGGTSNYATWGISADHFGSKYLTNSNIAVHVAKTIHATLQLGLSLHYIHVQAVEQITPNRQYFPQFSALYVPSPDLYLGFSIVQPIMQIQKKISNIKQITCGATYSGIPKSQVSVHVSDTENESVKTVLSFDYELHKSIGVSVSIANRYTPFAFGFQYLYAKCTVGYRTELHSYLGFAHTVSFLYNM